MIHLIIDDLYKYICSFLPDSDYRTLTETCRKLFEKRGTHSLQNYYGLNVLFFTRYSISHLDLTINYAESEDLNFKKSFINRFSEITHVKIDINSANKLMCFSNARSIDYIVPNDMDITIPKRISNLNLLCDDNELRNIDLIGGEDLISLTILAHIDITKLRASKIETLIISTYNSKPMSIDLSKFNRLRRFTSKCPIEQFISSSSLEILKLIASKNTYIDFDALPNLKELTLREYNNELTLPSSLQKLKLYGYDKNLKLPDSLRTLKLRGEYNQNIILNEGLIKASFDSGFSKPLILPSTLKELSLIDLPSKITFNHNLKVLNLRIIKDFSNVDMEDIPENTEIHLYYASDIFKLLGVNNTVVKSGSESSSDSGSDSGTESENSLSEVD